MVKLNGVNCDSFNLFEVLSDRDVNEFCETTESKVFSQSQEMSFLKPRI